jgi:hypothetical protein
MFVTSKVEMTRMKGDERMIAMVPETAKERTTEIRRAGTGRLPLAQRSARLVGTRKLAHDRGYDLTADLNDNHDLLVVQLR